MNLFFLTFACVGMMFILKYGTILSGVRAYLSQDSKFFTELFTCALCLGWWSGVFIGILTGTWSLALPFYSAAVCWIGDVALDIVISKYQNEGR